MEHTPENQKVQATLKTLNELKEKVETLFSREKFHELQSTIASSIEETQAVVGHRIDAEMKKTLKGTVHFLNGARAELDGIQKRILKLMGGKKTAAKKVAKKPAKKAAKKAPARKVAAKARKA
jgi:hypothetical protein